MCGPAVGAALTAIQSMSASTMFAASLGVSALSAGIDYIGQQQMADAQLEAAEANLRNTTVAANADASRQAADLNERANQTRQATALDLRNRQNDVARAQATAAASSQSAGLSFEALSADFDRQYADYTTASLKQLGWDLDQIDRQLAGVQANAQSRINSVRRTPIQSPSILGAAAQVGGQALSAFDTYTTRDPVTGERTFS